MSQKCQLRTSGFDSGTCVSGAIVRVGAQATTFNYRLYGEADCLKPMLLTGGPHLSPRRVSVSGSIGNIAHRTASHRMGAVLLDRAVSP
jgi:hypothetical protein